MARSNGWVLWVVFAALAVGALWFLAGQPHASGGTQTGLQGATVSPTPQPTAFYYNEYTGPQAVEAGGEPFTCEKTTSVRGDQGRIAYGCTPQNAGDALAVVVFLPVSQTNGNYSSYQFADEEQYAPIVLTFDSSAERATIDFHVAGAGVPQVREIRFLAGTSSGAEGGPGEAEYVKLRDEYLKSDAFKQSLAQLPMSKMTDDDLKELSAKLGNACLLNTEGTGSMGISFDAGATFDVEGPATAFNSKIGSRFVAYTVYADTVSVTGGSFTQKTGAGVAFKNNTNINVKLTGATGQTTQKSYLVPAGGQKLTSVIAAIYEDAGAASEYGGTVISRQRTLDTRIEDFRQKAQLEVKKYLLGKIVESYYDFQESQVFDLPSAELTELQPTKIVTFDIPASTLPHIAEAVKDGQDTGWLSSASGLPAGGSVEYYYDAQGAHGKIKIDYLGEGNYAGGLLKLDGFNVQIKLSTAADKNERALYNLRVNVNHAEGTISVTPAVVNFQFLPNSRQYYKAVQVTIKNSLPMTVHVTGCGLENFEVGAKASRQATLGGNGKFVPNDGNRNCFLRQNGVELRPFDAAADTHSFKANLPDPNLPETIPGG